MRRRRDALQKHNLTFRSYSSFLCYKVLVPKPLMTPQLVQKRMH
jgi:hypothetical protein